MIALLLPLLAAARVVTLSEALATAERNQPTLRQARADREAAAARADIARAPLLPQVTGTAGYQRATSNFAPRPGALPSSLGGATTTTRTSTETFNYWNFALSASQLLYDFGQTTGKWRAAQAGADAEAHDERASRLLVMLGVKSAYFVARAQKSLVVVARQTLENQMRHLKQIQGFVTVGTRPEIDLAQARTDVANAKVQLVGAESGYETAKAVLNQSIGVISDTGYDVADETLPSVEGEERGTAELAEESMRARPELHSIEMQLKAQQLSLRAVKGAYGPSLSAGTALTDQGPALDSMAWNWNGSLTLSWPLFQGLLTRSQVREAEANVARLEAQRDAVKQSVWLEIDSARLAVRGAKASTAAAVEALENARVRLRLAEGRYQAGVGNAIELGDAQLAATAAAAQQVQAEYNLAQARAQLLAALGRL